MEKRKAFSKGRLVKSKIDVTKMNFEQLSSESVTRNNKTPQGSEQMKKSITPTPSRLTKPKNILNKRTSDTPKLKIEELEIKRRSVPNTQENLESYYSSYIKALTVKLDKHKNKNTILEEELKQIELGFKLEENNMKKEIERLSLELKKFKKEKLEQETSLMEENFRIRREFEDFKSSINQAINEIIPLIQIVSEKNNPELDGVFNDVMKKIFEISVKEQDHSAPRLSLKDTASFSSAVSDVYSPKTESKGVFKEAIALFSYKPENLDEIELNVGDRVIVFNSDEANGLWTGKVSDKVGKFPRNCVMLD